MKTSAARGKIKDSAFYGCGNYGIKAEGGDFFFENVNIGAEIENGDDDIDATAAGIRGRNVRLGGNNGYVNADSGSRVGFENYQKVLGANRTWLLTGYSQKVTAGAGDPVPNQRTNGADTLLEITPNGVSDETIFYRNSKRGETIGCKNYATLRIRLRFQEQLF